MAACPPLGRSDLVCCCRFYSGQHDALPRHQVEVDREVAVVLEGVACRGKILSMKEHWLGTARMVTHVTLILLDSGRKVEVAPEQLLLLPPHLDSTSFAPGAVRYPLLLSQLLQGDGGRTATSGAGVGVELPVLQGGGWLPGQEGDGGQAVRVQRKAGGAISG